MGVPGCRREVRAGRAGRDPRRGRFVAPIEGVRTGRAPARHCSRRFATSGAPIAKRLGGEAPSKVRRKRGEKREKSDRLEPEPAWGRARARVDPGPPRCGQPGGGPRAGRKWITGRRCARHGDSQRPSLQEIGCCDEDNRSSFFLRGGQCGRRRGGAVGASLQGPRGGKSANPRAPQHFRFPPPAGARCPKPARSPVHRRREGGRRGRRRIR